MLTRTSVLCADRMVATSSWNGSSKSSAHSSAAAARVHARPGAPGSGAPRPFAVRGFATGSRYRVTLAAVDIDRGGHAGRRARRPGRVGSGCARHAPRAGRRRRVTIRRSPSHSCWPSPQPSGPPHAGRLVLAGTGADAGEVLAGCAVLSPAADGSHRPARGRRPAATRRRPPGRRASGPHSSGAPCARRRPDPRSTSGSCRPRPPTTNVPAPMGFVPERDLLQMRVPLPLPADVVAATRPLATRPFEPGPRRGGLGGDQQPGLRRPPRAGRLDRGQLRERMAADWVELDGFLVADDPDGGRASSGPAGPRSTGTARRSSARSTSSPSTPGITARAGAAPSPWPG